MINMSAMDTDGDGIPEIALAYGFGANPSNSSGNVAILKANGDPTALWSLKEIDAVPDVPPASVSRTSAARRS